MFSNLVNKINKMVDNTVVGTQVITKGKTTNQLIEEIHENFYTEVDRLLAEAKISKSVDTTKQELIDKCARLRALGFTNTKEVQEAQLEISRLEALKKENATKQDLIEAINHFSFHYPQYKFITEASVKKICAKYNLIYGTIDKYIGTVPDANIKQMETFTIKEVDEAWESGYYSSDIVWNLEIRNRKVLGVYNSEVVKQYKKTYENKRTRFISTSSRKDFIEKAPLEIAAPLSDFNTKGMGLKDFKLSNIEIPDPVVLCPVLFKGVKHYLVICAWGQEASDELVVNERNN